MAPQEGTILGMGNPLLDISANVDKKMLEEYGLEANNAILAEDKHLPIYDILSNAPNVDFVPGGATLNTMRVGQWILQQPNVFSYFGSIGDDKYSKQLIEKSVSAGVNFKPQVNSAHPTGTCACLITSEGQHRSLIANLAAANHFTRTHFDVKENWGIVEKAKYYYIGGFFLTVSPESILEIAEHACKNNKYLMMNLSAPFISQFFADPLMKCLPYVDILFGNETEAAAFSKQQNLGTDDIKEIALKISAMEKRNGERQRMVVFTQGADPTIIAYEGKVTEYSTQKLSPDQIVDTNGAGDSFVGGFLSQFITGADILKCVEVGHYAATYIIQQSGVAFNDKPSLPC